MSYSVLDEVAREQALWSAAAGRTQSSISRTRRIVLALAVIGATLEALALNLKGVDARAAQIVAAFGAAALTVAPYLTMKMLGRARIGDWTRARAASEMLKSEAFRYRAGAAPHDDPGDRENTLRERLDEISQSLNHMRGDVIDVEATPREWSDRLTPQDYIEERVVRQAKGYYEPAARRAKRAASFYEQAELALGVAAAILGVLVAANFWSGLAPWIAVLTTMGATVTAHAASERNEKLLQSYTATANRLNSLASQGLRETWTDSSPEWSSYVEACESTILNENQGWTAVWLSSKK